PRSNGSPASIHPIRTASNGPISRGRSASAKRSTSCWGTDVAKFVFNLPDIVAWHVKVGDKVEEDGRLADMLTDKATVEMESPVAGTVVQVAGEAGDVVPIGSPLVV